MIRAGVFYNDGIAHVTPHFFKPACFRMLLRVPGASSSLGLPGNSGAPGLGRMFELPVAAARRHKLPTVAASSRNISLTFTPQ